MAFTALAKGTSKNKRKNTDRAIKWLKERRAGIIALRPAGQLFLRMKWVLPAREGLSAAALALAKSGHTRGLRLNTVKLALFHWAEFL